MTSVTSETSVCQLFVYVHSRGHNFNLTYKNFVIILFFIRSRSSQLGHVGLKTMSLGQMILEKPCVHSRGHSFNPKFMKLYQTVNSY